MIKAILVSVIIIHYPGTKDNIATVTIKKPMSSMEECKHLKHQYEVHPPYFKDAIVQGFYCHES